jgi:Ca2+-binding EF-hand superfamily protein
LIFRIKSQSLFFNFFLALKYGFRKVARKNDYIRIEEIGDAFRQAGQNPADDTIKDMIDKATKLKTSYHRDADEGSYTIKILLKPMKRSNKKN